ncbi:hypothetical protein Q4Q35_07880 [Flavivirga aquimarina]|uniref:Uncharacterized protein n=1 Tax=Flavivirga aquimarina TaxID=2027862 RepID=A0ABT8W9B2_9FLAO|nr:hypothetical protein [Flavivirga aquimarina]MDO5969724.1 hypothetical protein [Flavivirga aquimarina]
MLGLLLIYFIGKRFYDLSEEYSQNKWLYAILGIVIYYVGTFIVSIVLAVLIEFGIIDIDLENSFVIGLIALPFGIGAVYLFYILLEKKWKKAVVVVKDEISDIGKNIED